MAVIIPCAGKSSRFPGTRPKYLLSMPDGRMMIEHAAQKWLGEEVIIIPILKMHAEYFNAQHALEQAFGDKVTIHVLDEETTGPADTVYQVAKNLNGNEPIFIQDCDSHFDLSRVNACNYICTVDLRNNLQVQNVAAKSFVVTNEQDIVTNIVEKSVVSNHIVVGGYCFETAEDYCEAFESLDQNDERFVSHVVKKLLETKVFISVEVDNYIDVGTADEWYALKRKSPLIICDLDGTLIQHQSKYFHPSIEDDIQGIPYAVEKLLKKQKEGAKFIFLSSRPEETRKKVYQYLTSVGFKQFQLILGAPHGERILINDYSNSNPFPTASAINVPRNDDDFWSKF